MVSWSEQKTLRYSTYHVRQLLLRPSHTRSAHNLAASSSSARGPGVDTVPSALLLLLLHQSHTARSPPLASLLPHSSPTRYCHRPWLSTHSSSRYQPPRDIDPKAVTALVVRERERVLLRGRKDQRVVVREKVRWKSGRTSPRRCLVQLRQTAGSGTEAEPSTRIRHFVSRMFLVVLQPHRQAYRAS